MLTESEKQLIDEIKSIMGELFNAELFPSTTQITILTPKEGVPIDKEKK